MNENSRSSVLIVEDDPSWQNLLAEIVIDEGYEVDIAADLQQAEAAIRDRSHRIAIVDMSMDMNNHRDSGGFRILEKIRQYDPGCTPLVLSGYLTVDLTVKAMKAYGAYTCLQKDNFSRSGLKQVMQEMLAQPGADRIAPAADMDRGREHIRRQRAKAASAADFHALIVEDDAGWRKLLSELVEDAGCRVQVCGSYGEAVGLLRRDKYHLAIIDLSLDRQSLSERPQDGYRLLRQCGLQGITAVVVSGESSAEEIEQAYKNYQLFAFLEKQAFERSAFIHTVEKALAQNQFDGELEALTERELQVLALLAQGLTNKEIAHRLIVSPNTIKRHLKAIFEKLGVRSRASATAKAISAGITQPR